MCDSLISSQALAGCDSDSKEQATSASPTPRSTPTPAPSTTSDGREASTSETSRSSGQTSSRECDAFVGGFPCQPFSVAGKQRGERDERNLWPHWFRLLRVVRPRVLFAENVPGLLAHEYFRSILCDLASVGYDAEWTVIGADDVGAPPPEETTLGRGPRRMSRTVGGGFLRRASNAGSRSITEGRKSNSD